jgi:hypothetical protein
MEPITDDRYVHSAASFSSFTRVRRLGKRQGFATVHRACSTNAELGVDAGLSKWIEDKVS